VSEIKTTDETIRAIMERVNSQIKKSQITPNWTGDYFSSNQLADTRRVFEKNGFETARVFLSGKMKPKGNQWELRKNEIILDLLEQLNSTSSLDVSTKAYIIGNLNSILTCYKKEVGQK
jgi:hypothetical protein